MRYAFRSLRRRPLFAAVAALTIALGIGANTAIFGVVYPVLLQPLPFRDPARLVELWQTHPTLPQLQVTVPDFEEWRAQARSFESISAYTLSAMNTGTLLGQGEPTVVHATMAGADLFATMGIRPLAGRLFTASEERARGRVAVLSESLWRRQFGADPAVVGREIRIDADSFRVAGVIPQRQAFPVWADLWIPLSLIEPGLSERRKFHPLEIVARVAPGVTAAQADSEIRELARRASAAHPDTNRNIGAYAIPLAAETTRAVRPPLLLAWAAVALVFLIACANLAHLFLARLAERRREIAVRRALGAPPWRLARQILAECLLVAAAGGLAGAPCGLWARRFAASLLPQFEAAAWPAPVWIFAAAVTFTAALLFAFPACWQVWRAPAPLDSGVRVTRSRWSAALMAAEIAMSLLVLAGAALLTRSFAALLAEDPGFRARQVWVAPRLPIGRSFADAPAFLANQLLPAVRAVPGVVEAAAANTAPLGLGPSEFSRFATRFGVAGRAFDPGGYPVAQTRWITPGYFRVLGIPLESGRWLDESDSGQPRALVNATLARRFFPHGAIGQHLVLGVMDPQQSQVEIVGVVGDVREFGMDRAAEPTFYGIGASPVMTLMVRTASPSAAVAIRRAIHAVDPDIAVSDVRPLEQDLDASLAKRRFTLALLAILAAIAAFLTAAGIYALFAQAVASRTRELGVRAAVGAAPSELVRMILRESVAIAIPGLTLGIALALGFARLMRSFVYGVSPADPLSIAAAALFLASLAALSAWLPARRAAAIDPASALRSD